VASFTIAGIASALDASSPRLLEGRRPAREAAVAVVLRQNVTETELLLIHRAEDPNDPWSGHMAFPGGRVEDDDCDPFAAAVRETREEVAIDLERHGRLIGRLSDVVAMARGKRLDMVIVPFVFELRGAQCVRPNSEVQEAVWVPLAYLANPANRSTVDWNRHGTTVTLPCCRYAEHLIWGLTYGMVTELLTVIGRMPR
jgi:8-oxo-dGTP pyrophosphatase MutT (NUDIX family)